TRLRKRLASSERGKPWASDRARTTGSEKSIAMLVLGFPPAECLDLEELRLWAPAFRGLDLEAAQAGPPLADGLLDPLGQGDGAGRATVAGPHETEVHHSLLDGKQLHLPSVGVDVGPDLLQRLLHQGQRVGLLLLASDDLVGLEEGAQQRILLGLL